MANADYRGCPITGATPAALEAFERAIATFRSWRTGTERELSSALRAAPEFVMAHVFRAYLHLSSRDPAVVRAARPVLEFATALRANARERMHLAAIAAVLADDYERAKALLGDLLREQPRDALALQVAHALDYVTGDLARLGDRLPRALQAWSKALPGHHAVLAMHAFGLSERGEYQRAGELAQQALALEPFDARAHHVLAHVFEMTNRPEAGIRWMLQHAEHWAAETVVATHGWWHVALFHLAAEQVEQALEIYDRRVRAGHSTAVSDMIDAAALLWRIHLRGGGVGARWNELASAWAAHIGDGFCSFNDLHAMISFVGAGDWDRAQRLEGELAHRRAQRTRYGNTTRRVGLTACRGLVAFGRGDYPRAIGMLASLSAQAHRIGGSHAQRDLLTLTLSSAAERVRRSGFKAPSMVAAGRPTAAATGAVALVHPGLAARTAVP
jgi:tetratricopeptide (TPR) repeat protein